MVSKNFFLPSNFQIFVSACTKELKATETTKRIFKKDFLLRTFYFCNLFITNQYDCFTVQMTERDYTTFETIDLTSEEVLQCSYSNWSKLFPGKTFPSKIIKPLPSTF